MHTAVAPEVVRPFIEHQRGFLKMKNRNFSVGALLAALMIAVPVAGVWATSRAEAEQAIASAKAAEAKAASAGATSSESAQMIKEAEGLLPSKQYTKARQLAKDAIKLSESAVKEAPAKQQANAAAPAKEPARAASSGAEAQQVIASAELARKRAGSVGGEWSDTADLIKEAKKAAESGDYAEAARLADQARRQGDLGYEQALHEKNAGFPSYMK
jgi:hypothetical protein